MNQRDDIPDYLKIGELAASCQLEILGAFHPDTRDQAPGGTGTLLLLGPKEPGFWNFVSHQPEFQDQQGDPIDRWSSRVISTLATGLNGTALFPFGGPPYEPFIAWASRSGRAWASPVTLLVHDRAGLFLSYRGAIALPDRIALPPLPQNPCDTCKGKPCRTACPVNALTDKGYDLKECHNYLDMPGGASCMDSGCAVRGACPVSKSYARNPDQSAYHMKAFHP